MTACTMFLKIFTSLPGWQLFFSRSNGEVFNLHTKRGTESDEKEADTACY